LFGEEQIVAGNRVRRTAKTGRNSIKSAKRCEYLSTGDGSYYDYGIQGTAWNNA
jgi:hypothetical protein